MAAARAAKVPRTLSEFAFDDAEAADAGSILSRVGIDRVNADISGRMQEISPRLFLGSEKASAKLEPLASAGIRLIVCVMAEGRPPPRFSEQGITYKVIAVEDDPEENLLAHFLSACRQMSDVHVAGGAVLVHCRAGASRSAAVVTAYLMWACGLRAGEALNVVQAGRCIANPNVGFRRQLLAWERRLYDDDDDDDGCASDDGGGTSTSSRILNTSTEAAKT